MSDTEEAAPETLPLPTQKGVKDKVRLARGEQKQPRYSPKDIHPDSRESDFVVSSSEHIPRDSSCVSGCKKRKQRESA